MDNPPVSANTPKPIGRLTASLEPMTGIYNDLRNLVRRLNSINTAMIGPEPPAVETESPPGQPTEASVQQEINLMVDDYSRVLNDLQHEVSRLESI